MGIHNDPFYHLTGTGNGHNTQINRIAHWQKIRPNSPYKLLSRRYGGYKNDIAPGGNHGQPYYDQRTGQYYFSQQNRPPVDPIEFDTGTTLGAHSRSRVKDKTLGRAIGWAGFGLDLFSGILGGITKLFRIGGGYSQPEVDPRIANQSVRGYYSRSSSGTNPNSTMPNMVWSKISGAMASINNGIAKMKANNKALLGENKALQKKLDDLEASKGKKEKVDKRSSTSVDTMTKEEKENLIARKLIIINKLSEGETLGRREHKRFKAIANLEPVDKPNASTRKTFNLLAKNYFPSLRLRKGEPLTKELIDKLKVNIMLNYEYNWAELYKDQFLDLAEKFEKSYEARAKALEKENDFTQPDYYDDKAGGEAKRALRYIAGLRADTDLSKYRFKTKGGSKINVKEFVRIYVSDKVKIKNENKLSEDELDNIKIYLIENYDYSSTWDSKWSHHFGGEETLRLIEKK